MLDTVGPGVWMAGAIGLACRVGTIGLTLMATAMVVAILWLLQSLGGQITVD